MIERGTDHCFAHRVPLPLDVRRFAEQEFYAFPPDLRDAGQVDRLARNGRKVDLEIAAVEDTAVGRIDAQRHRARDGMVDVDKFDGKAPQLDPIAGADGVHLHLVEPMLAQFVVRQSEGEFRRVDGHIDLFEKVRDAADVILVPVRDEQAADLVFVRDQIADIGDDQIDAGQFFVGESKPRVDDDDIVAVLDGGHVFADLAHAAEEHDLDRVPAPALFRKFFLFAVRRKRLFLLSFFLSARRTSLCAFGRRTFAAHLCLLGGVLPVRGVLRVAEEQRHICPALRLRRLTVFFGNRAVVLFLFQISLLFGAVSDFFRANMNRGLNKPFNPRLLPRIRKQTPFCYNARKADVRPCGKISFI